MCIRDSITDRLPVPWVRTFAFGPSRSLPRSLQLPRLAEAQRAVSLSAAGPSPSGDVSAAWPCERAGP
eukprot:1510437-Prymnesium_polylepis.1